MATLKTDIVTGQSGTQLQLCVGASDECHVGDGSNPADLRVWGPTELKTAVTCLTTLGVTGVTTLTGALDANSTADFAGDVDIHGDLDMNTGDITAAGAVAAASLTVTASSITVGGVALAVATRAFGTFTLDHSEDAVVGDTGDFGIDTFTVPSAGNVRLTFDDGLLTTAYVVLLTQISGTAFGDITRHVDYVTIACPGDCVISFVIIKA